MSSDPEEFLLPVFFPFSGDIVVVAIKKNALARKSCKSPPSKPETQSSPSADDFLCSVTMIRWPGSDLFGRCTQIAKTIRPVASKRAAIAAPWAKFRGQGMMSKKGG